MNEESSQNALAPQEQPLSAQPVGHDGIRVDITERRAWRMSGLPGLLLVVLLVLGGAALTAGALILRRRGVYFSLLTLALTAMLYAVAFRWTAVTGGENGFGGVERWAVLDDPRLYYTLVAAVAFAVVWALRRFHASPVGTVLVAIRENEQRARFVGYDTDRYKLLAFVISASVIWRVSTAQ